MQGRREFVMLANRKKHTHAERRYLTRSFMKKSSTAVTLTLLSSLLWASGHGCSKEEHGPPKKDDEEKKENRPGGVHGSHTFISPRSGFRSGESHVGSTPRGGFGHTGHSMSGAS
jgi:hypothetical protein